MQAVPELSGWGEDLKQLKDAQTSTLCSKHENI